MTAALHNQHGEDPGNDAGQEGTIVPLKGKGVDNDLEPDSEEEAYDDDEDVIGIDVNSANEELKGRWQVVGYSIRTRNST